VIPHTLFWLLVIVIAVIYIVPKMFEPRTHEDAPKSDGLKTSREHAAAKFYGGPLNKSTQPVPLEAPYLVFQYIPEDETERGEIIGHLGERVFYQPSIAYYQQVTDQEYFYVRDLTNEEAALLVSQGVLPPVEGEDGQADQ
jgi:hypothetical protein